MSIQLKKTCEIDKDEFELIELEDIQIHSCKIVWSSNDKISNVDSLIFAPRLRDYTVILDGAYIREMSNYSRNKRLVNAITDALKAIQKTPIAKEFLTFKNAEICAKVEGLYCNRLIEGYISLGGKKS